jgi:hypothetical protein
MDPILLSLVGFVILVYFSFVILLAFWIKSVTREKNECRVIIASLKREPQEKSEYSGKRDFLASNLVDFGLAYYERAKARTEKKRELANEAMKLCWERLPRGFQEKLAILGGLANLKVGDHSSS